MRQTTGVPATMAIAIASQPDALTTRPLSTPLWRPTVLLHSLYTWAVSRLRRRPLESRWIRPGLPRLESPTDILAREHVYLFIDSMSV